MLMVGGVDRVGGGDEDDVGGSLALVREMSKGRRKLVASAVRAKRVMAKVPWRIASGWRIKGIWSRGVWVAMKRVSA